MTKSTSPNSKRVEVSTEDVKKLRELTGAGMMDAKAALMEAKNFDDAITLLRHQGHATLAKKVTRVAKEGIITSYIHAGGKVGVLLELNCETDFVARNEEFKKLAWELVLHIAAAAPIYVSKEEVSDEVVEKERQIYLEQAKDKLEKVREEVVTGKLEKFYEQVVLMEQAYIRDDKKKVKDLIAETVGKLGENIQVRRFTRFVLGGD